jgi:transcriptional regulator GlxA family with amidase domain
MFVSHNSFSAMESYPLHRSPDPRIRSSFAFIEANLHQRLRLSELARQSGLSPARYSHLFALSTGMTPGKYIRSMRSRRPAKPVS